MRPVRRGKQKKQPREQQDSLSGWSIWKDREESETKRLIFLREFRGEHIFRGTRVDEGDSKRYRESLTLIEVDPVGKTITLYNSAIFPPVELPEDQWHVKCLPHTARRIHLRLGQTVMKKSLSEEKEFRLRLNGIHQTDLFEHGKRLHIAEIEFEIIQ